MAAEVVIRWKAAHGLGAVVSCPDGSCSSVTVAVAVAVAATVEWE